MELVCVNNKPLCLCQLITWEGCPLEEGEVYHSKFVILQKDHHGENGIFYVLDEFPDSEFNAVRFENLPVVNFEQLERETRVKN